MTYVMTVMTEAAEGEKPMVRTPYAGARVVVGVEHDRVGIGQRFTDLCDGDAVLGEIFASLGPIHRHANTVLYS